MKKKTIRKLLKVLEKTDMSFILLFDPTEDDFNSFKRKKRKIKGMKYIYRRLDEETQRSAPFHTHRRLCPHLSRRRKEKQ